MYTGRNNPDQGQENGSKTGTGLTAMYKKIDQRKQNALVQPSKRKMFFIDIHY